MSSNDPRGKVTRKIGDHTYSFHLDMNAICDVEAETRQDFSDVVADFQKKALSGKVSFTTVRMILFHGLKSSQPDVSMQEVGRIVTPLGKEAFTLLGEVLESSGMFDADDDADTAGNDQDQTEPAPPSGQ